MMLGVGGSLWGCRYSASPQTASQGQAFPWWTAASVGRGAGMRTETLGIAKGPSRGQKGLGAASRGSTHLPGVWVLKVVGGLHYEGCSGFAYIFRFRSWVGFSVSAAKSNKQHQPTSGSKCNIPSIMAWLGLKLTRWASPHGQTILMQ